MSCSSAGPGRNRPDPVAGTGCEQPPSGAPPSGAASAGGGFLAFLDGLARRLAMEVHTLWLIFRHRRTPWPAKAALVLLLLYLASPIDLVPDVIPVLGMLDDLLVAAAALWLAYRMTPRDVVEECRARADAAAVRRGNWLGALRRRLTE